MLYSCLTVRKLFHDPESVCTYLYRTNNNNHGLVFSCFFNWLYPTPIIVLLSWICLLTSLLITKAFKASSVLRSYYLSFLSNSLRGFSPFETQIHCEWQQLLVALIQLDQPSASPRRATRYAMQAISRMTSYTRYSTDGDPGNMLKPLVEQLQIVQNVLTRRVLHLNNSIARSRSDPSGSEHLND